MIKKIPILIIFLLLICGISCAWSPISELKFINPTPSNQSTITVDYATINASIKTNNLSLMAWNWNGTNTTFLNESCVMHIPFDNNSAIGDNTTVAADVSHYGNNGSFANGSTGNWSVNGKWNSAMAFDGVDDYVDCGNDGSLNITDSITVSCWIQRSNVEDYMEIISKHNAYKHFRIENAAENGAIMVQLYFDDSTNTGEKQAGIISDLELHQVAFTYSSSSGELTIYKDGIPIQTWGGWAGKKLNINTNPVLIGKNLYSSIDFFNGYIDEVRIYNHALSSEEVRQSYLSNLHKFNATQWYFKTTETSLSDGEYNYQVFANNVSGDYRILYIDTTPSTLIEEIKLIMSEITTGLKSVNMGNYLVYAFILLGILLIILVIQIINNGINRG